MRYLSGFFTIVLSVLCLAVLIVWIRSYFHSETFFRMQGDQVQAIDSFGGEISFWRGEVPAGQPLRYGHEHWKRGTAITSVQQRRIHAIGEDFWMLGFGYTTVRRFPLTFKSVPEGFVTETRALVIPFWFIASFTSIAPALWLRQAYRAHQFGRKGLCRSCGYDLRASSDRCPECGALITEAASPRTAS